MIIMDYSINNLKKTLKENNFNFKKNLVKIL